MQHQGISEFFSFFFRLNFDFIIDPCSLLIFSAFGNVPFLEDIALKEEDLSPSLGGNGFQTATPEQCQAGKQILN